MWAGEASSCTRWLRLDFNVHLHHLLLALQHLQHGIFLLLLVVVVVNHLCVALVIPVVVVVLPKVDVKVVTVRHHLQHPVVVAKGFEILYELSTSLVVILKELVTVVSTSFREDRELSACQNHKTEHGERYCAHLAQSNNQQSLRKSEEGGAPCGRLRCVEGAWWGCTPM